MIVLGLGTEMRQGEAHVRIASRDAWRAAEGGPGAAGTRHDRDDDALRQPLAARARDAVKLLDHGGRLGNGWAKTENRT